jgi:predicted polyphosphate/ATP-dependent NAD kinase
MFSSAFALNPRAAARLVEGFLDGAPLVEEEVLDIDEDSYRENQLDSRLYGTLLVPEIQESLQPGKVPSGSGRSSRETKQNIAAYLVEKILQPDTLYLLGPGTTLRPVAEELGVEKTLLGVDAVRDGQLLASDINESQILELLEDHDRSQIIVTPIGGNGFIFGRGNKQFTPEVIRRVGRENILVLATRKKLQPLEALRVDTGDREVDQLLEGYLKVIVGYLEGKVMKVTAS